MSARGAESGPAGARSRGVARRGRESLRRRRLAAWAAAVALAAGSGLAPAREPPGEPPGELARELAGEPPGEPSGEPRRDPLPEAARSPVREPYAPPADRAAEASPVVGLELLVEGAAWPAVSPRGDRVAYSRPGADGVLPLSLADPDGGGERCLTCLAPELRDRHAGNATFHPSGEWLVFQLAKPFRPGGDPLPFQAVPGRNLGDDLWAIRADGRAHHALTRRRERGGRVLSPRFSWEGDRLAWAERVASGGDPWGQWVLRVGRFAVKRGLPRLADVDTLRPGDGRRFFETYGFAPDERSLLVGAELDGQGVNGLDLYRVPLDGGPPGRLTATPGEHDRFAALAPDGRTLVWGSNRELAGGRRPIERADTSAALRLDLWMQPLEGGEAVRLTHFNDPFSPRYAGRRTLLGVSWGRDGRHLYVGVAPVDAPERASLYRLLLDRPRSR